MFLGVIDRHRRRVTGINTFLLRTLPTISASAITTAHKMFRSYHASVPTRIATSTKSPPKQSGEAKCHSPNGRNFSRNTVAKMLLFVAQTAKISVVCALGHGKHAQTRSQVVATAKTTTSKNSLTLQFLLSAKEISLLLFLLIRSSNNP